MTHVVREMMFGMREEFRYFECDVCCCLSLMDAPDDMSIYYPSDKYYSFSQTATAAVPTNPFRRWLKNYRDHAVCFNRGGLGAAIARHFPNEDASACRRWLRQTSLRSPAARILDVGCGQGWHLSQLHGLGFTSLTGVDPYLTEDIQCGPIRIHASHVSTLVGREFDFIMLHHSLEHMPNQVQAFKEIRQIMAPAGECMVRIPIVSRGPWKTYGTNWAEIDAPRHFVLHSEMSLKLAAEAAGLVITGIQYESEAFTYAASELYRRDLSLYDSVEKRQRPLQTVFDDAELQGFEALSSTHYIPGWAGRAAFFLTRSDRVGLCGDFTR